MDSYGLNSHIMADTSHLHQPPKGRQNYNRVQPSYSDISRSHGHNENDSDVMGPTVAETVTQHTKSRTVSSPGRHVRPSQRETQTSRDRQGTRANRK
jgi:hypothetical protein